MGIQPTRAHHTHPRTQGFGFIAPNGGGPDVFVHQSEIKRQGFRFLAEGEAVEFRVEEAGNGKARAFDVTGAQAYSISPP